MGLEQISKTPVVILQELGGERVLPIWIGPNEASAIAMELQGLKYPRPLTHDLAASIIRGLGGTLQRVVITRLQENTYFAELVIQRGTEIVSVDARPSDSIAIALRLQAPLFTPNELLSASTIQVEEHDEGEANSFESTESTHMTAEQLQEYLKKLKPEDLGRFNP
jgi:bifunctional DNase/RNase